MTQGPDAAAQELLIETNGHVRLLTLNRPERRNALSASLRNALSEALLSADEDDSVRVVVLTGAGEQAFCAGADLKDMRAGDDSQQTFRPPMGQVERSVFEVALETKKPVIAALNGSAVAGGFELALGLRSAHHPSGRAVRSARSENRHGREFQLGAAAAPDRAVHRARNADDRRHHQRRAGLSAMACSIASCRAARFCRRAWPWRTRSRTTRRFRCAA